MTPTEGPPLVVRLLGRTTSGLIARAPSLWPLLRRPTRAYWQRAAAGWDSGGRTDAERAAPLLAACDRLETPPKRALEVGTGTGAGALAVAARFPEAKITAVDLSPAMIAEARRKLPPEPAARVEFLVADASDLPFEPGSFDLVFQQNLPMFAKPVAAMVAPGGHLIAASSLGPSTPYHTPEAVLRRHFEPLGLEVLPGGAAGAGTYFLARRPA